MIKWIERFKEKRRQRQYDDGYQFATFTLANGTETPSSLMDFVLISQALEESHPFDRGIIDAINKMTSSDFKIIDNRHWDGT